MVRWGVERAQSDASPLMAIFRVAFHMYMYVRTAVSHGLRTVLGTLVLMIK